MCPLHGLSISIKAHIGLEGRETPVSFIGWLGQKSPADANVVKILLEAGYLRVQNSPFILQV
jgi:Asp-tRNA(Asn)/Glu-tRNA(Gln) amidotransferase A subunit family amidase